MFLVSQYATAEQGTAPFHAGLTHHYEALPGDGPALLRAPTPDATLAD